MDHGQRSLGHSELSSHSSTLPEKKHESKIAISKGLDARCAFRKKERMTSDISPRETCGMAAAAVAHGPFAHAALTWAFATIALIVALSECRVSPSTSLL